MLIDAKALMFVVGTEMDYVTSDIKSEFVFNNPNSKVRERRLSGDVRMRRELQCLSAYINNFVCKNQTSSYEAPDRKILGGLGLKRTSSPCEHII